VITIKDAIQRIRIEVFLARHWLTMRHPKLYEILRRLEGARRPQTAGCEGTGGTYEAPGVSITFGGACPVQGTGEIDGHGCYYRARGEGWSLEVYDCEIEGDGLPGEGHLLWEYGEGRYIWPLGGWLAAEESRRNIARAVRKFRRWVRRAKK